MMKFSPYMILIGGVDDTTLDLKQTCCKINSSIKYGYPLPHICKGAFDLTTAFKQRGAMGFTPMPNITKHPSAYGHY